MGENTENKTTNPKWRKMGIKSILFILIFYCILFIFGIYITIKIILFNNLDQSSILDSSHPTIFFNPINNKVNYHNLALIGSLGSSLLGSSIFYIRKLYKLCIEKQFDSPNGTKEDKLQSIGTLVYFIFRPFFALAFAMLIVIGIESSMISLTNESFQLNNSFTTICMFVTFFIGFSSGKFLKALEKKSDSVVSTILDKPSNQERL